MKSHEALTEDQRGWLQLEQGRLFFECAGEGDPVVFLHGFGLDLRMWTPQFEALQSTLRVIRYDLRGFGRSSLSPINFLLNAKFSRLLFAY